MIAGTPSHAKENINIIHIQNYQLHQCVKTHHQLTEGRSTWVTITNSQTWVETRMGHKGSDTTSEIETQISQTYNIKWNLDQVRHYQSGHI